MGSKNAYVAMTETERELRLQRDNFMRILEAVTDDIYIVSHNCDIEYVNPVIEREFGKVDGRKCHEYFHGLKEPCSWCKNETVFNGGSVRWEWHSAKTGKTYDLFDTPIMNADGTVSKFEIFHDITQHKAAEKALMENETLFRNYFELGQVGMAITSLDQKWLRVNDRLCEMLGYTKDELTKMTWAELTHPDDLEPDMVQFKRLLAGEIERYAMDKRFFNKSGGVVHTHLTVACQRRPDHTVEYIIASVQDITGRVGAEMSLKESEGLLKTVLELLPVGVWILNTKGELIFGNQAATGIWTGKHLVPIDQLGEYKGWRLESGELIGPHDWAGARALEKGEASVNEEIRIQCFDGTQKIILDSGVPIRATDGSIRGAITLNQDITERKVTEEKLRAAKEEAEAATRLKDKFVSLVAHDLKGPIGNSIMALQHLQARLKEDGLPIADDPMLNLSISTNETMLQLIEDLLQMSRIKSGAISPRFAFTDAYHLFQHGVDFNSGAAERKGITIANLVPPRTRLYCDMKLTGEVVVNLVSNAIKFSKKGDTITIGKKAQEPSTFFIKDTGVGIPPDRLSTLFKYEVPTSTAGTAGERGTGMGLPLSYELIHAQGGSLQIESSPGKGTAATISFPHVVPKTLVVEDSNFDREIARMFLKEIGIKVIEAEHGEEALRLMETELPHLVLLDVNLPGVDGFEILRHKAGNPKIAAIPVIVITGSVDPNLADEAFRLGAVDFIKKPLQPEILTARVRRIVS